MRPDIEEKMKLLHMGLSTVWVIAFGLFLVFPFLGSILHVKRSLTFTDVATNLSVGAVILAGFVILASFVDDLVEGVSPKWADEARKIRALWRRKQPHYQVDEAIQQGKAPSRSDLEKLPLLRQINADDRRKLLDVADVVVIGEGEAVCRQGDSDRTLYILLSGRLAVAKNSHGRRRKVVALLEPGAVFGEAAFFLGKARTADVVAVEDSRVLAIPHDDEMPIVAGDRGQEMQFRLWFLQALVSSPYFRELPSEALDALIFAGTKTTARAGEKVISEGERADSCYFLIQGRASVVQNMTLINRMKSGDVFGEIALMKPGTLRTASVVADSDLLMVRVEGERFWALLCSHLPLAVELERLADARLALDKLKRRVS